MEASPFSLCAHDSRRRPYDAHDGTHPRTHTHKHTPNIKQPTRRWMLETINITTKAVSTRSWRRRRRRRSRTVGWSVVGWVGGQSKGGVCRDPGSNRGHLDLQSNALPTELSRLKLCSANTDPASVDFDVLLCKLQITHSLTGQSSNAMISSDRW